MNYVIIGKSASGKDTILQKFVNLGFNPIVRYTTRPKRENELENIDYHFISDSTFEKMNDDFVGIETFNTLYEGTPAIWKYATLKSDLISATNRVCISTPYSVNDLKNIMNCKTIFLNVSDEVRKSRAQNRPNFDSIEWDRRAKTDSIDFDINCDIIIDAEQSIDSVWHDILEKIKKD